VETFGAPQVTQVATGTRPGPGILVTGHDLRHLNALLEQSEGRGVNVYTHGEMLPAHGYPALHRHPHLAGNLGGSWVQQRSLFEQFPGAILGTTNCVLPPRGRYEDRMFTSGIAGLEGVAHIEGEDFEPVIAAALGLPPLPASEGRPLQVGFHHTNVLELAPQIIDAVKRGAIRRFFLVAGCDCPGRGLEYYQELTRLIPKDCVILTLACGKFRYNTADYGAIEGIPRFIDLGQCNNAYSAIQIAAGLAGAFGVGLNDLPLSIVASWFEQKAVAILLSLFHLGIKGIRLGPKPPAWISPGVFQALQEGFDLKLIGEPAADLELMLAGK
jgi:hydroxylamine reductase